MLHELQLSKDVHKLKELLQKLLPCHQKNPTPLSAMLLKSP